MATLFSKIHRLKSLGWTWDEFMYQLEKSSAGVIDEKTLKALYRQPHRKATRHVTEVIENLHDQFFPTLFPSDAEALVQLYGEIFASKKFESRDQSIVNLEAFLSGQLALTSDHTIRTARLHWLQGNIAFDRIAEYRSRGRSSLMQAAQASAIEQYQIALNILQTLANMPEFTLYKLRQNILACYLNAVPPENRYADARVIDYVVSSDFLGHSQKLLEAEPYQWTIARNALRFSSLLKDKDRCRYFYEALLAASNLFSDLSYNPGLYPPLDQSADFNWALLEAINV